MASQDAHSQAAENLDLHPMPDLMLLSCPNVQLGVKLNNYRIRQSDSKLHRCQSLDEHLDRDQPQSLFLHPKSDSDLDPYT